MARTKTTYTVVITGAIPSVRVGLTLEEAATILGAGTGDDGTEVYLFKGNPIPFTVNTEPTVTIGEPKQRRTRATKQETAPMVNKDGTERKKPGRKPKQDGAGNGVGTETATA